MRANHRHYIAPEPMPLFDPPAQPVDTSLAAAAKITKPSARMREAIYLWLKTQGVRGATAGELERGLGRGSTLRPRLRELEGTAPWAKGKLPMRILRTSEKRDGMRVYVAIGKVIHNGVGNTRLDGLHPREYTAPRC